MADGEMRAMGENNKMRLKNQAAAPDSETPRELRPNRKSASLGGLSGCGYYCIKICDRSWSPRESADSLIQRVYSIIPLQWPTSVLDTGRLLLLCGSETGNILDLKP